MLRRLLLTLALVGSALLGSGVLRLAHEEVAHGRRAAESGACCSTEGSGCEGRGVPTPERPRRGDGRGCVVCAMLASLSSEPPQMESGWIAAVPGRVGSVVESEGVERSIGLLDRWVARGPPATV